MKFYFRKLNKIKLQQKLDPQEVIRFSEQSTVLKQEGLDVGSSSLSAINYSAWCLHLFQMPTLPFAKEWQSMWQVKAQNQDDLGGVSNREGTDGRACSGAQTLCTWIACCPALFWNHWKVMAKRRKLWASQWLRLGFAPSWWGDWADRHGKFSISCSCFLSQLAPATMSSFETQNLEETQMLQRELHRESLHQGFLRGLVWHLWHSSSSSLAKSLQSFPTTTPGLIVFQISSIKYL